MTPAEFPEPTVTAASMNAVFVGYLDYFRDSVALRVAALGDPGARTSGVPSGWTPLELAAHLRHVERRWLEWGFLGRDVGDPWADQRDGRWSAPEGASLDEVLDALRAQGEVTREVVLGHRLDEVGAPGERWDGAPPAALQRVLMHLVQEYARHLGHLDVVTELAGGPVGE